MKAHSDFTLAVRSTSSSESGWLFLSNVSQVTSHVSNPASAVEQASGSSSSKTQVEPAGDDCNGTVLSPNDGKSITYYRFHKRLRNLSYIVFQGVSSVPSSSEEIQPECTHQPRSSINDEPEFDVLANPWKIEDD